jgi:hypothetical protein
MMHRKVVETSITPDGRFIWEIGEVDNMGGGFGCLFIDRRSGDWTRTLKDVEYSGTFFDTRWAAAEAGKAELRESS